MPATPLTAQECYLLERYTSLEYYGRMRDAWEAMVRYVEDLLDRYMQHLPDAYRNRPLPKQPDVVWGERVLPNFRSTLQSLYDGYIKLSHGDWSEWGGIRVSNDFRGQTEFWPGWMDEVELGASDKYFDLINVAVELATNVNATGHAWWSKGELGDRYSTERGPLDPPSVWPRYRLDPSIRVASGEPVANAGLYWPEAPDAAIQFLIPSIADRSWTMAPEACVGLTSDGLQNDHEEPTHWIKIERIDGETVSDGLTNLLTDQDIKPERVPANKSCPRTGWWFTPAKANSRRYFKLGDVFPTIEGSAYGDTYWQWSPDQSLPQL